MEKFTNGGWKAFGMEIRFPDESSGEYIHPVASVSRMNRAEHDAALISAAPEMYDDIKLDIDWLKRLRSLFVLGSDGFRSCSLRIESKEKLLSKARGE